MGIFRRNSDSVVTLCALQNVHTTPVTPSRRQRARLSQWRAFLLCLRQSRLTGGIAFSTCPLSVRLSVHSSVAKLVNTIFWKRIDRFRWKLAQMVGGASAWKRQLRGPGGQRSRSWETEIRFGGLAEVSFSTSGSSGFSSLCNYMFVCLFARLRETVNPLIGTCNYSATSNNSLWSSLAVVGWAVQLQTARRGLGQSPPRCSQLNNWAGHPAQRLLLAVRNSPPINGQCTIHCISVYKGLLLYSFNVAIKGLKPLPRNLQRHWLWNHAIKFWIKLGYNSDHWAKGAAKDWWRHPLNVYKARGATLVVSGIILLFVRRVFTST